MNHLPVLLRDVDVGGTRSDVLLAAGRIAAVGHDLEQPHRAIIVDANGRALLPGLHDHHVHLLALAARDRSLALGPPNVRTPADFDRALRSAHHAAPSGEWIRAVDHEDEVGGILDRHRLDAVAPTRAVRVQHRSGAQWVLSSAALDAIGIDVADAPDGVEVDSHGRPTGRLWRLDEWLRAHLPRGEPPDLATLGRRLATFGITGVTDATPSADPSDHRLLAAAVVAGDLPVTVTVTGGPELARHEPPAPLRAGPVKIVAGDHDLPDPDALAADISIAHAAGRTVAIHCVTRAATAVAVAAWNTAGSRTGDRVEHASVVDMDLAVRLAELGLTVVTQPAFVRDRGDHYLAEVEPADRRHLYRCRSLLEAGIPVGGSTDAPFGPLDPWRAIAAAIDRRTATGHVLGADEALTPARALQLFLTSADQPGGRPRSVARGAHADLCLLDRPLHGVLADPESVVPLLTVSAGVITHRSELLQIDDREG